MKLNLPQQIPVRYPNKAITFSFTQSLPTFQLFFLKTIFATNLYLTRTIVKRGILRTY